MIFGGIGLVSIDEMTTENIAGILAGVLTAISSIPQLVKIVKEKDGEKVSVSMLLVLIAGLITWVVYGVMKEDWPVIITNAFSAIVNITILVMRQVYKSRK